MCTHEEHIIMMQNNCSRFEWFTAPPVECRDTINNCAEYDIHHDLCATAGFERWIRDHCISYCKMAPCNGNESP